MLRQDRPPLLNTDLSDADANEEKATGRSRRKL